MVGDESEKSSNKPGMSINEAHDSDVEFTDPNKKLTQKKAIRRPRKKYVPCKRYELRPRQLDSQLSRSEMV